ncbi:hypothetical protein BU23DRAFT_654203 [Bimuria novae-zelandiae CBS 107.79]|uniref:Uncharacterized protein n=1 Tax=Bimuria novae-zelandiae CBS 107.79 TaxID=1447943 RepID=A0A6A5VQQ3_9PLEO|nr:hypothetical protein BU23DRAFT_654203 [Bimuria novae-zelandiae CBS 107.79]
MELHFIAFGVLAAIVAAVPTNNDNGLLARNVKAFATTVDDHCFPQETPNVPVSSCVPTGPGTQPGCDPLCMNTTSSTDPACDPLCMKYNCCTSSGCRCRSEVLDELERNPALNGNIEVALRNIDPADIDLASEASANFICQKPCGPRGSKCCFFQGTKHGDRCLCLKGVSLSLDKQLAAAVKARSEVSFNFKCEQPCGEPGSKCCFFQNTRHGGQCLCPQGVSPSLDKQPAAAVEVEGHSEAGFNFKCEQPCGPLGSKCCFFQNTRHGDQCLCPKGSSSLDAVKARSPSSACTPWCQGLLDYYNKCLRGETYPPGALKEGCDREICTHFPQMYTCDFPMCALYVPPKCTS